MTPLLYACSTGLADVVKELAERLADMNVVDDNGRGCLQLAISAQGANQPLAHWLRENTGAMDTAGWGREVGEKQTGRVSSTYLSSLSPKAASGEKGNTFGEKAQSGEEAASVQLPGGKGKKGPQCGYQRQEGKGKKGFYVTPVG